VYLLYRLWTRRERRTSTGMSRPESGCRASWRRDSCGQREMYSGTISPLESYDRGGFLYPEFFAKGHEKKKIKHTLIILMF
jgi:hypothetical protein